MRLLTKTIKNLFTLMAVPFTSNDLYIKSSLFYIILLFILIGVGFILFKIIDHKYKQIFQLKEKEIREQTIKELKIDHQLIASRAVLMGEEKERGRISRDLHDGLGGKLSGIRILLSNLKKNIIEKEAREKLEQALFQLNSSISELRMIAHNIMPESLVNFGLKDALNDFCINLKDSKNVEISFLFYGEPYRFDNSIETSFFRIAQEAVNNALKYAEASKIVVQLIQDESWVNLTIQDNGKGFDVEEFKNKKAGGLKNIRARAESFDGRFHIDSHVGIGTEIIVEFIYNTEVA
jgi:signal transduction histidine kinase